MYKPENLEPETMYIVHWTVAFESGNVDYKRMGIVRWDVDQYQMKLYFDRICSMASETFPTWGKLIKFWVELDQ